MKVHHGGTCGGRGDEGGRRGWEGRGQERGGGVIQQVGAFDQSRMGRSQEQHPTQYKGSA
jgi:hypothetical protein